MQSLKDKVGYVSLKVKYYEQQEMNFPALSGGSENKLDFLNIEEKDIDDDHDILPMNPIQEKDNKIAELEQKISEQAVANAEFDRIREALTKNNS